MTPQPTTLPLIGIVCPIEEASFRGWAAPSYLLMVQYADHVRAAGGVPLLLPIGGGDAEIAALVGALDGILFAGGVDINPATYGQDPHGSSGPFSDARDEYELRVFAAAQDADLPVLGICRGLQLVNVALGGTLEQHLPDVVGHHDHAPVPGQFAHHPVRTADDSHLGATVGASLSVPVYHHQSVGTVAPTLRPVAWADDGTVEGLEDQDARIVAVQWHPEMGDAPEIFEDLVARARAHRSAAAPVA